MNSFGEYLRNSREQLGLPLSKAAAELNIDTSILSKIERSERLATKETPWLWIKTTDPLQVLHILEKRIRFVAIEGAKNVKKFQKREVILSEYITK